MSKNAEILGKIATCTDENLLRNWIVNAKRQQAEDIADAAFRRLVELLPKEQVGSLEWDFWRTIHAFELTLSAEKGKTTRLSRTRQKVQRVGVRQTLSDWAVNNKQTDGFTMLLERNMPELTGEAIVLRHASEFAPQICDAARHRLISSGVDIERLQI